MKKHKIINEFAWRHLRSDLRKSGMVPKIFQKFERAQQCGYLGLWMRPEGIVLSNQLRVYRGMDYEET